MEVVDQLQARNTPLFYARKALYVSVFIWGKLPGWSAVFWGQMHETRRSTGNRPECWHFLFCVTGNLSVHSPATLRISCHMLKANVSFSLRPFAHLWTRAGRRARRRSRPSSGARPRSWASATSEWSEPPSAAPSGSARWRRWPRCAQTRTRRAAALRTWWCFLRSTATTHRPRSAPHGHVTSQTSHIKHSEAPAQDRKFFPREQRCILLILSWLRIPPGEFMTFGLRVTAAVSVFWRERLFDDVAESNAITSLEHCKVWEILHVCEDMTLAT